MYAMYAGKTSKNKHKLTARKCFHRLLKNNKAIKVELALTPATEVRTDFISTAASS